MLIGSFLTCMPPRTGYHSLPRVMPSSKPLTSSEDILLWSSATDSATFFGVGSSGVGHLLSHPPSSHAIKGVV